MVGKNKDQHRRAKEEPKNVAHPPAIFFAVFFALLGFGPGGDFYFGGASHAKMTAYLMPLVNFESVSRQPDKCTVLWQIF